jgi:hypothetical protein
MNKYKFQITYKENHPAYGPRCYEGEAVIEAVNMEEAKEIFKQFRYSVKQVCVPSTLSIKGENCEFIITMAKGDV